NPKEISSETFSGIDDGNNMIRQDCSKDNIVVFKDTTAPLLITNGFPEYTVEIFNACNRGDPRELWLVQLGHDDESPMVIAWSTTVNLLLLDRLSLSMITASLTHSQFVQSLVTSDLR
ncbi:hypothetical protein HID58_029027, partial [Brassica napus]